MELRKRAATALTVGALLGGSFVGLGTSEAVAGGHCDAAYVVKNNSSGSGRLKGRTPVFEQPYSDCASKSYRSGTRFSFWCSYKNTRGSEWIFGSVGGTDHTGWVSAGNITGRTGSLHRC
ncbi:hypothetical protein ABT112_07845 [Streptomyces sp. NPDC002055]|uniref:hypothetical protein n=1 Tax=Streptomyces sp. NPDC002055 TaxID=3154534 RepID=UPI00331ADB89